MPQGAIKQVEKKAPGTLRGGGHISFSQPRSIGKKNHTSGGEKNWKNCCIKGSAEGAGGRLRLSGRKRREKKKWVTANCSGKGRKETTKITTAPIDEGTLRLRTSTLRREAGVLYKSWTT